MHYLPLSSLCVFELETSLDLLQVRWLLELRQASFLVWRGLAYTSACYYHATCHSPKRTWSASNLSLKQALLIESMEAAAHHVLVFGCLHHGRPTSHCACLLLHAVYLLRLKYLLRSEIGGIKTGILLLIITVESVRELEWSILGCVLLLTFYLCCCFSLIYYDTRIDKPSIRLRPSTQIQRILLLLLNQSQPLPTLPIQTLQIALVPHYCSVSIVTTYFLWVVEGS